MVDTKSNKNRQISSGKDELIWGAVEHVLNKENSTRQ